MATTSKKSPIKDDIKKATKTVKEETKKVADKAKKNSDVAKSALKEVAKETAKKAEKATETTKKAVKDSAKKTTEKAEKVVSEAKKETKTAATTAKKAAKKTAQKLVTKDIYFEYGDKQVDSTTLAELAEKAYTSTGKKASSIKSMKLYVKAEDNALYYVINGKETGKIEL